MKIDVNPLNISSAHYSDALLRGFQRMEGVFSRIRKALDDQEGIIDRMEEARKGGSGSDVMKGLVDELDRVTDRCEENNRRIMDGRYSRVNPLASMWMTAGLAMHSRERIFISTMTSAGLGLRQNGGISTDAGTLERARRRIDKCRADMNAYSRRVAFLNEVWKGIPENAYEDICYIEKDIKRNQIELLRTVRNAMLADYRIIERIQALAREIARKDESHLLHAQVEVSALVDEVDRLASQTSYNRFRLLCGDYSEKNPMASFWFCRGAGMKDMDRIYIQTVTARSLGLVNAMGETVSISSLSGKKRGILEAAMMYIRSGIEEIEDTMNILDEDEGFDRAIRVEQKPGL